MGTMDIITVMSNRSEVNIDKGRILYVEMHRNVAEIHLYNGNVVPTRNTMDKISAQLGDNFVKVHRSLLVSVMAIHEVGDYLILINGEKLDYVKRKRKEICSEIESKQKAMIGAFSKQECPETYEEYRKQGIASSLLLTAVRYAQANGFDLIWECVEDNLPSIKTAMKCGFRKTSSFAVRWFDLK